MRVVGTFATCLLGLIATLIDPQQDSGERMMVLAQASASAADPLPMPAVERPRPGPIPMPRPQPASPGPVPMPEHQSGGPKLDWKPAAPLRAATP